MDKYKVAGKEYPVTGLAKFGDSTFPIVDIPMMSDERWNELCKESTMHNYEKYSGKGKAPDYETALKWEKDCFAFDETIKAPAILTDAQGAKVINF